MMKYFMFFLFLSISLSANACFTDAPFEKSDIKESTAIFVGEPVAYESLKDEFSMAKVRFKVIKLYKGNLGEFVDVVWQNSTFGTPANLEELKRDHGERLTVGLIAAETFLPLRGPSTTYNGYKDKDLAKLPKILQAPCSEPFMFTDQKLEELGIEQADFK